MPESGLSPEGMGEEAGEEVAAEEEEEEEEVEAGAELAAELSAAAAAGAGAEPAGAKGSVAKGGGEAVQPERATRAPGPRAVGDGKLMDVEEHRKYRYRGAS